MSSKGLKIHQTKMGYLERQHHVMQESTHKTPNDTGPEANHSPELVRGSLMASDPVRQRIKFPRAEICKYGKNWMALSSSVSKK